jgi:hypothetical protein
MEKINRVFEQTFGQTYNDWHKTKFCAAEKEYSYAKQHYRHDPIHREKWKCAKAHYRQAMFILETYERLELELS